MNEYNAVFNNILDLHHSSLKINTYFNLSKLYISKNRKALYVLNF